MLTENAMRAMPIGLISNAKRWLPYLDAGCDAIQFAMAVQIGVLHIWRSTSHVHSEEADALLSGLCGSTLVLWDDHNGGQAHCDVRVLVGRGLPAGGSIPVVSWAA